MSAWLHLLAWLNAVAGVVGPISIIVGLPGVLVGTIVGIVKVRRWMDQTFAPAQVATQAAAQRASDAATDAATAATSAAKHSKDSKDSNDEIARAVIFLAEELGKTRQALADAQAERDREAAARDLEAARNDEVFGALLRAKSSAGPLLEQPAAGPDSDDDDGSTVSGRHRLHPSTFLTLNEGDPA